MRGVGDLDESGNGGGFGGLCNHQQAKANSLKFLQIISIIIRQNYYLLSHTSRSNSEVI